MPGAAAPQRGHAGRGKAPRDDAGDNPPTAARERDAKRARVDTTIADTPAARGAAAPTESGSNAPKPFWLAPGRMSEYEKQRFPDTPVATYVSTRDALIRIAAAPVGAASSSSSPSPPPPAAAPPAYLHVADAVAHIRADVNTIVAVHTFLEKEGVINYGAAAEAAGVSARDLSAALARGAAAPPLLLVDTPRGLRPSEEVLPFTPAEERVMLEALAGYGAEVMDGGGGGRHGTLAVDGVPLTLDGEHFKAESYLERPLRPIPWEAVAARVHRTASECRQWFMKLRLASRGGGDAAQAGILAPGDATKLTPFADSGNQVMQSLAFLAAVAPPAMVARCAAAAEAALAASESGEEGGGGDEEGTATETAAATALITAMQATARAEAAAERRRLAALSHEAARALLDAAAVQVHAVDTLAAEVRKQRQLVQTTREELYDEHTALRRAAGEAAAAARQQR